MGVGVAVRMDGGGRMMFGTGGVVVCGVGYRVGGRGVMWMGMGVGWVGRVWVGGRVRGEGR